MADDSGRVESDCTGFFGSEQEHFYKQFPREHIMVTASRADFAAVEDVSEAGLDKNKKHNKHLLGQM